MPELLGKQISPIGLGLMGLTWRSTPPPQEQAFATMRAAIANGCYCWNGGEFYGTPDYNSLVLLERYFERYPEDADKVVLNIKGGVNPKTHQIDGSPDHTRRTLDDSIAQLKGRKKIDMFEFARRDPNVPLEVTFGIIDKEYVQTGKIGGISLSEVRAETIHEAVRYTKVVAVEAELSMFTTDILDNGVAAACAQYGIPIIAYSPIGRGMLTGRLKRYSDLPKDSLLQQFDFPRFQQENFEKNLQLVSKVEEIAAKKGCTPAQLAINWTIALSRRLKTTIMPIPGSSTPERVEENGKILDVSDEELDQIDTILKNFTPAGGRYPPVIQTDT
ncbi:Aldo/keto reductase [Xylona heveae TC161]|uniref:Aldo/keto reductase n=1 Tax=Xylona heveae (strain CBS 132557 / TC161) TaxID=1328760 RepID=A0A165H7N4_XYLHT|nr:Aldo/keto reductase [Xylona heveae TC161]KZF23100.1 Aldo/keto reductase [Xylona heveae TC161]